MSTDSRQARSYATPVPQIDELLTPEQTARLLAMSPKFVRDHAREIGAVRFGGGKKRAGRLRFRRSDVERYIAEHSDRRGPDYETQPHAQSEGMAQGNRHRILAS